MRDESAKGPTRRPDAEREACPGRGLLKEKAATGGGTGLVHRWIEAQAAPTPGAVAVAADGRSLTYVSSTAEPTGSPAASARSASAPRSSSASAPRRSLDMLVALLAVLKAGGAYVPLDPAVSRPTAWPSCSPTRSAPVLVTEQRPPRLAARGRRARHLPRLGPGRRSTRRATRTSKAAPAPTNLAYVIYTSGSTGTAQGRADHPRRRSPTCWPRCAACSASRRTMPCSPSRRSRSTSRRWSCSCR